MEKNKVRPPVVVVLGHVDHGKTTLLDALRSSAVAEREFGQITQHIGAYELLTKEKRQLTFIDTPGHEAFNTLRSRGASVADIALLLVAADDSVQPQTVEAIKQIRAYKIPFIVVINKIDAPGANIEKVLKDLTKQEIYVEGRGGETPKIEISAKNKTNLDGLLELITLVADMANLSFDSAAAPEGVVIEVKKDRRGVVATVILRNGTFKVGDNIYFGTEPLKVRALFNDRGQTVNQVWPSTPVEVLGSKSVPVPGSIVSVQPQAKAPVAPTAKPASHAPTMEDWYKQAATHFNFIIKADAYGTLEAIAEKFAQFEEIKIIKMDTGELTEADLELAKTTKANVLIFNTKLRPQLAAKAEKEEISVFEYNLIYELLDQVEDLIYALRVKQEKEERKRGEARIIARFNKETQSIAGLRVIAGKVTLNDKAEIFRGKKLLKETTIGSLYQKSTPVPSVNKGEECGAIFTDKLDFQTGDSVKLYSQQ